MFQRTTIRPIEIDLTGTPFDLAYVAEMDRELRRQRPASKPMLRFHPKEWEVVKLFFVRKSQSLRLSDAERATHAEGIASLLRRGQIAERKTGLVLKDYLWERMGEGVVEETATEIEFERLIAEVDDTALVLTASKN